MSPCTYKRVLSLPPAGALALLLAAGNSVANPTGPTVVHGNATISQSGNVLQVTNSPNTIINWQSFSIPSSNVTQFIQQGAASAVLNRVTGTSPSTMLGALQSNGQVFLINPNGVIFGAGSQVSVASFTVSTGQLSGASFLAGATSPSGGATLSTSGSSTLIIGPLTLSSGSIGIGGGGSIATSGTVFLNTFVNTTGGVTLTVNNSTSGNTSISGSGVTLSNSGADVSVTTAGSSGNSGANVSVATAGSSGNSGAYVSVSGSPASTMTTGTPAASNSAGISGTSSANSTSASASARPAFSGGQDAAGRFSSPSPVAFVILQKREPLY